MPCLAVFVWDSSAHQPLPFWECFPFLRNMSTSTPQLTLKARFPPSPPAGYWDFHLTRIIAFLLN